MKNLIKKYNIIEPINISEDVKIAVDENIHGELSWTAAMPKGELAKLKKVCKPVASHGGITIWVLDEKKTRFVQNNVLPFC